MKTFSLIGIVAFVHFVAIGSVMLIQGCGTVHRPVDEPVDVIMPSTYQGDPVGVGAPDTGAIGDVPNSVAQWPSEISSDRTTYVIKSGDCLSGIAKKYDVSLSHVMEINNISNPNLIRSGQKIVLPGKFKVDSPVVEKKPAQSRPAALARGGEYVVGKGDCLSKIAVKYGLSVQAIKDANGLASDKIVVGKKLIIPGDKTVAPTGFRSRKTTPNTLGVDLDAEPIVDASAVAVSDRDEWQEKPSKQLVSKRTHIVSKGEDLKKIAKLWGLSISDLKEYNQDLTDAPLKPGQIIYIPMTE